MNSFLFSQDNVLLEDLSQLSPLERLGKIYYTNTGNILRPPQTARDSEKILALSRYYQTPLPSSAQRGQAEEQYFSPFIREENSIRSRFDITVGVHPRFMGNAPHTHDFFELTYVCQGNMTQMISHQTLPLSPGDFIVLCPGVPHDILSLDENNVMLTIRVRKSTFHHTFFSLFEERDVFYTYFFNILHNNQTVPYLYFQTGEDLALRHLCLHMYRESNIPKAYSRQYLNLLMSEVFLELLRNQCDHLIVGTNDSQKARAPIALILQYMMENCKDATLAETAAHFHYNKSYLSRLLKEAVGKNFLAIRTEFRLQKACKLLDGSSLPITQIADRVGFSDVSRFYKNFKAAYQISPHAYRKQSAQEGNPMPQHVAKEEKPI